MKHMTKFAAVAVIAVSGAIATEASSSAMPMASSAPVATQPIEHVAWGCGPGFHPNPWGRCVPNGGWGGGRRWGWGGGWHRWHHWRR